MIDDSLTFRPYTKEDLNFISSSWGHNYFAHGLDHFSIPAKLTHLFHRPIRERILNRPTSTIIICCAKHDTFLIVGWICVEKVQDFFIIHYLYIKDAFRQQGIAKELVKASIPSTVDRILYTHRTDASYDVLNNQELAKRFQYTPHLI